MSHKHETDTPAQRAGLARGLATAVPTRIESHGELVWEPGMSDEEHEVRDRDIAWRNGGQEDVTEVVAMHVEAGRWTKERAEAHLAGLRAQAVSDRAKVLEFDRLRAAKGQP